MLRKEVHLNATECGLITDSVIWYGREISKNGWSFAQNHAERILKLQEPTTLKELSELIMSLLQEEEEVQACFLRYHDGQDYQPTNEVTKLFLFNEGRFEIYRLLDVRETKEQTLFVKVRWKGFGANSSTWESLNTMYADQPRIIKKLLITLADDEREDAYHLLLKLFPELKEKEIEFHSFFSNDDFTNEAPWDDTERRVLGQLIECFDGAWRETIESRRLPTRTKKQILSQV